MVSGGSRIACDDRTIVNVTRDSEELCCHFLSVSLLKLEEKKTVHQFNVCCLFHWRWEYVRAGIIWNYTNSYRSYHINWNKKFQFEIISLQ